MTRRIGSFWMGIDPKTDPEPLRFKSVGEGSRALNQGKVQSSLYEFEGYVVPYMVAVKVGNLRSVQSQETVKRDSRVLMMHQCLCSSWRRLSESNPPFTLIRLSCRFAKPLDSHVCEHRRVKLTTNNDTSVQVLYLTKAFKIRYLSSRFNVSPSTAWTAEKGGQSLY
ncbi:hypothetical protein JOM56_003192 [Amanita muscaria]